MKLGKRLLSFVLTASMLLGCMCTGVLAVDEDCGYEISKVQKYSEETHTIAEENVTTLNAGDIVVVTFAISNRTGAKISAGSYQAYLKYDSNIMSTYKDESDENEDGLFVESFAHDLQSSLFTAGDGETNVIKLTGVSLSGISLKKNSTTDIAQVAFKVKSDVESTTTVFSFDTTGTNNTNKLTDNQENVKTLDCSVTHELTINGVPPTVKTVTLNPPTVTVNGSNTQTVQAKATSAKGTDLTNAVHWSISNGDNSGVTINQNGEITVAKNAKDGQYIVNAIGRSSSGGGSTNRPRTQSAETGSTTVRGSASATLTVARTAPALTSIEITSAGTIAVPTATEQANTLTLTAVGKNQFGESMDIATTPTWSIVGTVPTGVTLSGATLSVAQDASAGTLKVQAAVDEKTATKDITITKAASVATTVTVNGSDAAIEIPGSSEADKTAAFTATVKDQYGDTMQDADVTWTIENGATGISVNDGTVTVSKEASVIANSQNVTIVATCGTARGTKEITVKRATPVATSMKVFKDDAELTGTTDTVIIPSGDTPNTYTYSAKVYDQYGSQMSNAQPTLSFATVNGKVEYNNGTVTVKTGVTKDSTYTLTVSYTGLADQMITITAKDIDITWPTASKASGTYGDKWSDIVKYSGGSAVLNGTNVDGTFAIKNASDVPDVSEHYQFVFKSTDGKYTVESPAYGAELRKKALTITAASASKRYDGTALTKNEYTANGLVNNDTIDSVTVTGTVTNVADTATNNTASNAVIKHGDAVKTANYDITYVLGTLTITKATLTIKAKDKTITYGEEPANDGVTYTGLANGEDGATVVTGLTYEYNYQQFGNVGEYVITPKGATAANYDITYQPGKLTVNQKEVGLTWSGAENLYYNGQAKNVTATATGPLNGDVIAVTVTGGKETAVGNYTAKATALTGEKAGNYKLPAAATKSYAIQSALNAADLTVEPATVTATIDGLTIKLVGYKSASDPVTVKKGETTAADNKLTVNGVEYTIDASGVAEVDAAKITVETDCSITLPEDLKTTLNGLAAASAGLDSALADLIKNAAADMPENAKTVKVTVSLNIRPTAYADGKLRLSIEPMIKYEYKDAAGTILSTKEEQVNNSNIKSLVTVKIKGLPSGFTPNFAKHYLNGSSYEMLPVAHDDEYFTWKQSSFSEVELVSDTRSATVNFTFEDGHSQSVTYGPADLGKAFPTDSKDGYTFNGWTIGDKTYTTLTEEALTELSKGASTLNATPAFTQNSSSGGNHGGNSGGGVSGYAVSVTTPKNGKVSVDPRNAAKGVAVTVTVTPDSGYEMDKLTVTDASGKTISTTDKGNGKFTFTMPNGKVSVSATFKQTTVTPPSTGFVDVPASAYYADAVKWAVEKGITTGTSATTFSPEAFCTRAQMVTFLWRAAGSPAPKATTTAFTDLDKSAYYYDAVLWAVEKGITTGTSATTFSPNATVTRGQTVTFLYRFAGQPAVSGSSSFTDVNSSDYYAAAVQWAKEQGITSGTSDTTFSPTNDCTRGQIVTFLYRQLAK